MRINCYMQSLVPIKLNLNGEYVDENNIWFNQYQPTMVIKKYQWNPFDWNVLHLTATNWIWKKLFFEDFNKRSHLMNDYTWMMKNVTDIFDLL